MFLRARKGLVKDAELTSASEIVSTSRRALFLLGPILPYTERQDIYSPIRVFEALLALPLVSDDPIVLFISSAGGVVPVGTELYDAIRLCPVPVTTVGLNCASLATVLLAAGHHRLVTPSAQFALHLPRVEGLAGDNRDIDLYNRQLDRIKETMVRCYLECGVRRSREQLLIDIDRTLFLNAEEAVEFGLADGIAGTEELFKLGFDPTHLPAMSWEDVRE